MIKKSSMIILIAISFLSLALAAPPSSPPHRVFGDIDNPNGSASVDISFRYDGESILSSQSEESGYYDVDIPYGSDYDGEELELFVDGSSTGETLTFSSGEVTEIDHTVQTQNNNQQQQNQQSGGGLPNSQNATENQNQTETEDNQTETSEDSTDDDSSSGTSGGVSGDDDDTEGNETEDDEPEGNLITGLFTGQPSQAIAGFFEGIINWFTSLF